MVLLAGLDPTAKCWSINLPHEIFWTQWWWFSTKLFNKVNFWPFLTDHVQYFRTWEMPIFHLHQPHRLLYGSISHLLSLKFTKVFWKIIKILWFLMLFWEIPQIINQLYFLPCIKDYSKTYECVLQSGPHQDFPSSVQSLYPELVQLLHWTLKRIV